MTLKGYNKLKNEVRYLKNIERPRIVEAIANARALGDLSENAEYHSAKEHQGLVESRIAELEDKLSKAQVIDVTSIKADIVKFGATVELIDNDTDASSKFQIVGSDEADIKNGLLPITSPLARAIVGKAIENTVEVSTPSGMKSYTVLSIQYI